MPRTGCVSPNGWVPGAGAGPSRRSAAAGHNGNKNVP